MKEVLLELYNQLKERYGITSKTWSDFHTNSLNQSVWKDGKNLRETFLEEYLIWTAIIPLLIEYGVSYSQEIDTFTNRYYQVYKQVFIETNGTLMYLN